MNRHRLITVEFDNFKSLMMHPGDHKTTTGFTLGLQGLGVFDSSILKRLSKKGIHGEIQSCWSVPLLTKKNTKTHLTFATNFCSLLCTDETYIEHLDGVCPIAPSI